MSCGSRPTPTASRLTGRSGLGHGGACAGFSSTRTARFSISRRAGPASTASFVSNSRSGDAAPPSRCSWPAGCEPRAGRFRAGGALAAGNTLDIVRHLVSGARRRRTERAMVERHRQRLPCERHHLLGAVPGLRETLAERSHAPAIAMGVATSDGTAAARAALKALGLETLPAACLRLRFGAESEARARHRARVLRGDRRAAARDRR